MKTLIGEFLKVFSIIAFTAFIIILAIALFRRFDTESKDIANIIIGGVITQITSIVSYWFGSSKGSADKTVLLGGQNSQDGQQ